MLDNLQFTIYLSALNFLNPSEKKKKKKEEIR